MGVGVLVRPELCDFNELDVELDMLATVCNALTRFRSFEYIDLLVSFLVFLLPSVVGRVIEIVLL